VDLRKIKASALHLLRVSETLIQGRLLGREHLIPYSAVYHATYRCNAQCNFCSRKDDITANGNNDGLSMVRIEEIFLALRQLTSMMYIAGGEPLLLKNITDIVWLAKKVGFFPVVIGTNAILLNKHRGVFEYADKIVVSIHSTEVEEIARIFNISSNKAEQMLRNIRKASWVTKNHGNELIANCVLTENNVSSAHHVLDFCLEYEIILAVVPAIRNLGPTLEKADGSKKAEYICFLDRVIAQKRVDPMSIQGTMRYLKRLRDFNDFECRPTAILTINPEGRIVNPCDYKYADKPKHLGIINGQSSVEALLRATLDYRANFRSCDGKCLKACYAEPAMFLENPLLATDYLSFLLTQLIRKG